MSGKPKRGPNDLSLLRVRASSRSRPHRDTNRAGYRLNRGHRAGVRGAQVLAVITVVQAAEIAQLLWERDPLAFLGLCASCKERGMTLLERIQQRAKELRP